MEERIEFRVWVVNMQEYILGNVVGEWLNLPMEEGEILGKLSKIAPNNEGCFIHANSNNLGIHLDKYSKIVEVNQFIQELSNTITCEEDLILVRNFHIYGDAIGDKEFLLETLEDKTYNLFYAENEEELGSLLYEMGLHGFGSDFYKLSQKTKDILADYIDMAAIAEGYFSRTNCDFVVHKGKRMVLEIHT